MHNRRSFIAAGSAFLAVAGISGTAWANKSKALIEAPENAAKGEEITIKVNVIHEGNSFAHHTDWVYVKVNGKEAGRWEFSMFNLPENENFSREIKYKVDGDLNIEAESHCNIHGSAGVDKKTVTAK